MKSVQQLDAGQYWCEVEYHDQTFSSERAWITVEGGTLNASRCLFLLPVHHRVFSSRRCSSLHRRAAGCGGFPQRPLQPFLHCCWTPRTSGGAVVAGRSPEGRTETFPLYPPCPRSVRLTSCLVFFCGCFGSVSCWEVTSTLQSLVLLGLWTRFSRGPSEPNKQSGVSKLQLLIGLWIDIIDDVASCQTPGSRI